MKNSRDKCPACGAAWADHAELVSTCERFQAALDTLKVISIWATFQGGAELVPDHVARLIGDTLRRIK